MDKSGELFESLKQDLPSAEFEIDSSDEEQLSREQVKVFSRSEHLNSLGILDLVGNETEENGGMKNNNVGLSEIETKEDGDDIYVEDIEEENTKKDIEILDSNQRQNENEDIEKKDRDEDIEWSEFRSTFESILDSSEVAIEQETEIEIEKLKQDLMIKTLDSLQSVMSGMSLEEEGEMDDKLTEDLKPTQTSIEDNDSCITENLGESNYEPDLTSFGPGKRSVLGRPRKGMVLHSNRFDRLSESDLDMVLESIQEESRENSVSPTSFMKNERGERRDSDEIQFTWEGRYDAKTSNEDLMDQLQSLNKQQTKHNELYNSVLSTKPVKPAKVADTSDIMLVKGPVKQVHKGPDDEENFNRHSQSDDNKEQNTVFLDLRPSPSSIDVGDDGTSESAKRLLAIRLARTKNRSSSEDSDNGDPYSWQEERRKIKSSLANIEPTSTTTDKGDKAVLPQTKSKPDITPNHTTIENVVRPKVHKKNVHNQSMQHRRKHSSESFSEDDVFGSPEGSGFLEVSSSEKEEVSPTLQTKNVSNKKGKKSKKKHRGKRKRKTSSGSDGDAKEESVGSEEDMKGEVDSSSTETTDNDNITETKGSVNIPLGSVIKHTQRSRKDSLTQSSDEELGSPRKPLISRSISSDGETFTGRDTEKMKLHLQRRIESRKPPSLFDTPVTPPLFHQDVSFTMPYTSLNPALKINTLLNLPLSETGIVNIDTQSLNIDEPIDTDTLQLLHILLVTWLISLYYEGEDKKEKKTDNKATLWIPFHIGGLQQMFVDGSPSISAGIVNKETEDELRAVLESSTLSHIITPLLRLPSVKSFLSTDETLALQTVLSIPLSSVFVIQSDPAPFTTPLSFYWHSFYDPKFLPSNNSLRAQAPIQTTVCTIEEPHLRNTELIFALIHQAFCKGMDIGGIRFAFHEKITRDNVFMTDGAEVTSEENYKPTLAFAFRGSNAIQSLMDIVGPESSSLAKVTDPSSLSAVFGEIEDQKAPIVSCVHSHYWTTLELAKWFGGRACLETCSILGVSDAVTKLERRKRQRVRFSESESEDNTTPIIVPDDIAFPPLISNIPALIVYPYSKIIFVASPIITPMCYSNVFQAISSSGFDILGIKRIRLNSKRASSLRIPSCVSHFTPSSAPSSPAVSSLSSPLSPRDHTCQLYPPLPSLLFILGRENAASHVQSLLQATCSELKHISEKVAANVVDINLLENPSALFHAIEYNEDCSKVLGSFTFTPTHTNGSKISSVLSQDEAVKEEISFVAIIGSNSLHRSTEIMNALVGNSRTNSTNDFQADLGMMELVGIKLVSELSRFQVKQLYAGNPKQQEAVDYLAGKPALLLITRGISANDRVSKILRGSHSRYSDPILQSRSKAFESFSSPNIDQAFHLASLFFIDKELFSDANEWALIDYVPSTWSNDCAILSGLTSDPESLLSVFTVSSNHTRLLVKILEKLTRAGFHVVGMRLVKQKNENEDERHSEDQDCVKTDWKFSNALNGGHVMGSAVAVCVQRYNAVWYLCHELKPFTLNSTSYAKALSYSSTFAAAVSDVQCHFPFGVHSSASSITKYYQISPASMDCFNAQLRPTSPHLSPSPAPSPSPPTSPLSEDTCLILPPSLLTSSTHITTIPYITILDVLTTARFSFIGMLMVHMSKQIAIQVCDVIDSSVEVSELSQGSCLVLTLRRDNGASCFNSIVTSTIQQLSIREDTKLITSLFKNILQTTNSHQTAVIKTLFCLHDTE